MEMMLFPIRSSRIHSSSDQAKCLSTIREIIENSPDGDYLVLCDGNTYSFGRRRKLSLYFNIFYPAERIHIIGNRHGAVLEFFYEVNHTAKRFTKVFSFLLLGLELVLIMSVLAGNQIGPFPLLILPIEILIAWYAVLCSGFAIVMRRYDKLFHKVLNATDVNETDS